jgi:hypothetical protein
VGHLIYGSGGAGIEFPDRTLAHLYIVMMSKLRRAESFGFSFDQGSGADSARTAIWISPSIPLQFIYLGTDDTTINREWLDSLVASSNSVAGLRLVAEPIPAARA